MFGYTFKASILGPQAFGPKALKARGLGQVGLRRWLVGIWQSQKINLRCNIGSNKSEGVLTPSRSPDHDHYCLAEQPQFVQNQIEIMQSGSDLIETFQRMKNATNRPLQALCERRSDSGVEYQKTQIQGVFKKTRRSASILDRLNARSRVCSVTGAELFLKTKDPETRITLRRIQNMQLLQHAPADIRSTR